MIWLVSSVVFVGASTVFALLGCEIFGSLTYGIALSSLIFGLALSVASFIKFRKVLSRLEKFSYFEWSMIVLLMAFCYRHFFWMIFQQGSSVLTLDPGNFGDLPKHINYITYLANGVHFWPEDPVLTMEPFCYYFGVDLFSALFTKLGISFITYLPIMGIAFSLMLIIALYQWGKGFAIGAFLFAGGGLGYTFFITHELKDYQAGKPWGNIITLFTVQRGFLYGLTAGLLLLWSWRRRFFGTETETEKPLPIYFEGLLWGTMPFFHLHTFIFISFVYGCWFLITRKPKSIYIFFWAVFPAVFEVYLVTFHFKRSSVIWWNPGWMIGNENIFLYFWNNYGLFVPLTIAACFLSLRRSDSWKQMLPAALMFTICMFVTFAPWDWDNIKLMAWCYILALPLMYDLCLKPLSKTAKAFCMLVLFIPGFIYDAAMHDPSNRGNEIYNLQAVEPVCKALKDAAPEARVATAQTHNHPVLICGHPVVAGYGGILWAQGLKNGDAIQEELRKLMMGEGNWRELAHKLKARYLFWGPSEITLYPGSTTPWVNNTKLMATGDWGKLFDLEETQ